MLMWSHEDNKYANWLTGAVAKQITNDLKDELMLTPWYRLATDRSSDENDKLLPVLIRHIGKD